MGVEPQLQSIVTAMRGTMKVLSCRVERMEFLIFSADFAHFDKVDQVLKAARLKIKWNVRHFGRRYRSIDKYSH